jgi:ABC-type multidrug transport system fused ATPase/permease subunit
VLSGLTESGILAVLAQVAATLVDGVSRVRVDIGPLHKGQSLGVLLALAFALGLVRLALQLLLSVLPSWIAAELQARLRTQLSTAFMHASWGMQSRDREGHLQEIMTDHVAQAIVGSLQAMTLVTALLTFFVLVISALVLNVVAALGVLVASAGLFALLRPLSTFGTRRGEALSWASMDFAGGVNEAIRLAEETHVFGVADSQHAEIERLNTRVRSLFFHTQLLARLAPGIYLSLVYLMVVAALAGLYALGGGHVAALGAVVLLLVRAGTYAQQAQGAYQWVRQSMPYLERIEEAQRRYTASTPVAGTRPLNQVQGMAFEHVGFAYEDDRPVLSEINFSVAGGEAVGIVGPSGAGKSTLVQLLLRLRAPDRGRYLVNGVPAEQFKLDDWHSRIAYVPQEPRLLHASVADNIRYFRDLDEPTIERAARLAGIHDEVMRWSDGYDTLVGPRADAVSGGQQQRICIARALAAQPEVLVLDEPTSALDTRSEMLIQESLAALKHQLTLFIVAHRLSTLDICERVMVIVDGQVEAFDIVSALRQNSAYYRSTSTLAVTAPETVSS